MTKNDLLMNYLSLEVVCYPRVKCTEPPLSRHSSQKITTLQNMTLRTEELTVAKNTEPFSERVLSWPIASKPIAVDGAPLTAVNGCLFSLGATLLGWAGRVRSFAGLGCWVGLCSFDSSKKTQR
jgi:hypothetical protein